MPWFSASSSLRSIRSTGANATRRPQPSVALQAGQTLTDARHMEAFELGDEASGLACGVAGGEEVAAEVAAGLAGGEHVPDQRRRRDCPRSINSSPWLASERVLPAPVEVSGCLSGLR